MSYYDRTSTVNTDGTPVFATKEDTDSQIETARLIEKFLGPNLVVKEFGHLSQIDFFAERDGRAAALIEVKARSHESAKFSTVFLNVRKWLALQMGGLGMCVPAFFFARFTDCLMYIDVRDVDASNHTMGGTSRIVKSKSDREPVIEIPISSMTKLCDL
jgi:hypothetical protein